MNGFVCVDTCVAIKWILPEPDSDLADALRAHILADNDAIIVPPHMPVEVVNTIRKKVRRQEIGEVDAETSLSAFLALPLNLTIPDGLHESALLLAKRFDRPTVYDTYYVALAQIAGCEMWTADIHLLNALDGRLPFVKDLRTFAS